jgi:hypothetical protein
MKGAAAPGQDGRRPQRASPAPARIIASLTTIPSRIARMRPALESILDQTVQVKKIELNVPYFCERTNQRYAIPDWLSELPRVEVFRTEDIGPITKIAPTLLRHRSDRGTYVWSCDDDHAYPPDQLAQLLQNHRPEIRRILAMRGGVFEPDGSVKFAYGYWEVAMFEGFATVLYPPQCIGDDFGEYVRRTSQDAECRKSDDLVLSHYFQRRKIPIFLCNPHTPEEPVEQPGALDYGGEDDALNRQDGGHEDRYKRVREFLQAFDKDPEAGMPGGAKPVRVVHCVHPDWSGYLRLFADGTSEQFGTSAKGRWSFDETQSVLTIRRNRHGEEKFRTVGGEFVFESIDVPKPGRREDGVRGNRIAVEVAAHPDRPPWTRKFKKGPTVGIVIPYRAREEHLKKLVPHLISFFARDVQNSYIRPLIVVSEQADDRKFNRGWCRNGGFLAVEPYCDYVCFHDVDYMPMWADYSYSAFPTQLLYWGMNLRPIRASADETLYVVATRTTLSGVYVIDKNQFRAANGFSNQYDGWGYEDTDLHARFGLLGIKAKYRDGTFIPLDHDHEGFTENAEKSADWIENESRYERLADEYKKTKKLSDGLAEMPLGDVAVEFERWSGLNESEKMTICRLRIRH